MDGLLARGAELSRLTEAIGVAQAGTGGLVVVEGPAGIGKTRLLQAACTIATERELRVLNARGGELERGFPFGVVRQLFETELVRAGAGEREQLLAGAAALAAPVLAPEHAPDEPSPDAAFSALHGLYWLIVNLASSRPLLLAVDDAHWADRASLRFMAYLLPRLTELPVLVLVASRPEDPSGELDLLRHIAADPAVSFVRPSPLGTDAVDALLRRTLDEPPTERFVAACLAATGGNPFLLGELITSLRVRGVAPTDAAAADVVAMVPDTVARSVLLRLARVSDEAPRLARAVAVLGDHAEVRHVAELAGVEPAAAAAVTDEMSRAGLLTGSWPLRFTHPILRSAVYADLPPGGRERLHAAAAELLLATGAPADVAGTHLLNVEPAGDPARSEVLVSAADQAARRGAPELALRFLERALHEAPPGRRAAILYARGAAEASTSRIECIDTWCAALAEPAPEDLRARIAIEFARAMVVADRQDEAVPVLQRLAAELTDGGLARRVEAELATTASLHHATHEIAVERLTAVAPALLAQPPERDTLPDRLMLANIAFGAAASGLAPADAAADLARRALADDAALPPEDTWFGLGLAVLTLAYADQFDEALEWFERAAVAARAQGSLLALGMTSCWAASVALRAGMPARAETEARTAIEVGRLSDWGPVNCERAFLADALIERGALDEAERVLEASGLLGALPPLVHASFIIETRGRLRLAQGRPDEALADFLLCGRNLQAVEASNPALCPWRSQAALANLQLGRPEQALCHAVEEVELARAFGAPRALGVALRARGLAEGGAAGIESLGEAVAVLERSRAPLEHARALVDLGAAIRRDGRARQARGPLLLGADLATRCGAAALAGRAHEELRAAGARPRRLALSGVGALTGSERRVAELAARGASNKDIAQQLFVTVRTVEMHLSSAYRKLGISSRAALGPALAGPEEVSSAA